MFNFLHNWQPQPVVWAWHGLTIHWYGVFIVSGMLAGLAVSWRLAGRLGLGKEKIFDVVWWLIVTGLIGARLYYVGLEWPYYSRHLLDIFKVWQGGLAIHGAWLAGALTAWLWTRKEKINFWLLTAVLLPGLALGQAIGRWGNYFNQELFGRPTAWPWGIPIDIVNRPAAFINQEYFQPTFLYESLGNLLIFCLLLLSWRRLLARGQTAVKDYQLIVWLYAVGYSVLRLALEFWRLDSTPLVAGWRWPQLFSLAVLLICLIIAARATFKKVWRHKL